MGADGAVAADVASLELMDCDVDVVAAPIAKVVGVGPEEDAGDVTDGDIAEADIVVGTLGRGIPCAPSVARSSTRTTCLLAVNATKD